MSWELYWGGKKFNNMLEIDILWNYLPKNLGALVWSSTSRLITCPSLHMYCTGVTVNLPPSPENLLSVKFWLKEPKFNREEFFSRLIYCYTVIQYRLSCYCYLLSTGGTAGAQTMPHTCMSLGKMDAAVWLSQAGDLLTFVSHNWGVLERTCLGEVLIRSY